MSRNFNYFGLLRFLSPQPQYHLRSPDRPREKYSSSARSRSPDREDYEKLRRLKRYEEMDRLLQHPPGPPAISSSWRQSPEVPPSRIRRQSPDDLPGKGWRLSPERSSGAEAYAKPERREVPTTKVSGFSSSFSFSGQGWVQFIECFWAHAFLLGIDVKNLSRVCRSGNIFCSHRF